MRICCLSLVFFLIFPLFAISAEKEAEEKNPKLHKVEAIQRYDTIEILTEPAISEDYVRGANLIYDCAGRFFACVDLESYEKCRTWRDKAIQRAKPILPCAPLKKFEKKIECERAQLENIHLMSAKAFCKDSKTVIFKK